LTPAGIRVGYPSARLLRTVPQTLRGSLGGRVVWITTANPYYALAGVRTGEALAAAERSLPGGTLLSGGRWYVARWGSVSALIEVAAGAVQEVGIADSRLTRTRAGELALLREVS
jgi:hypothetical protein